MNGMIRISKVIFICLIFSLTTTINLSASNQYCITKQCVSGRTVSLNFSSETLLTMQPLEVELKVSDKQGKPVSGALIYCSLYKPMVATGFNNPKINETDSKGLYKGIVFFTKPGAWVADLTINLPDGAYEEVSLEIKEVLPGKI